MFYLVILPLYGVLPLDRAGVSHRGGLTLLWQFLIHTFTHSFILSLIRSLFQNKMFYLIILPLNGVLSLDRARVSHRGGLARLVVCSAGAASVLGLAFELSQELALAGRSLFVGLKMSNNVSSKEQKCEFKGAEMWV